MVVAVSGAGGLGSLPGTPLTPQKLREGARPRARTRVCERTVFARHQALPVAATFEGEYWLQAEAERSTEPSAEIPGTPSDTGAPNDSRKHGRER